MLAKNIWSVLSRRSFHSSIICRADEKATEAISRVNLNLVTPSNTVYKNTPVDLVVIPGVVGEYGVTAGHTPIVSQMKPGVIAVHHEMGKHVEKFFTAGGFAFTHDNSTTDLACVEVVKVDDIDPKIAQDGLNTYKAKLDAAAEGTPEKLEAQIGYEVHQAMVSALSSP